MYEAIIVETDPETKVATVTLNRPEAMNGVSQVMLDELVEFWTSARTDDGINAIVVRGAAESKGFTAGVDLKGGQLRRPAIGFAAKSVLDQIAPRMHYLYKPVICAVHGVCAGAGLFIVNDSDIVLCSDDATFFDPHMSLGITSAMGPIGMTRRVNLGEVLRYTLMSNNERLGAETALRIGLVTEVTTREALFGRANDLAVLVASYNPVAVQGTLKAIWESLDLGRKSALDRASLYSEAARASSSTRPEGPAPRRAYVIR
jgi:enoyl-CoA hydratase/carnithine racemase